MSHFAYSLEQIDELFEKIIRAGQLRKEWFSVDNINYYSDYKDLTNQRKEIKRQLRQKGLADDRKGELNTQLAQNTENREYIERIIKDDILNHILRGRYHLEITQKSMPLMGKDVYVSENNRDSFFLCKIINDEVKKSFKLSQPNRNEILKNLSLLLSEPVEKMIVRCDIKHFFESIPRTMLMSQLERAALLNSRSMTILKRMFKSLSNNYSFAEGIPRGISFSPALADLYMRKTDYEIANLPGVYFYRRYVDDMIVIASPSIEITDASALFKKINEKIVDIGLELHQENDCGKFLAEDICYGSVSSLSFDYLGYRITLDKATSTLTFRLKEERIEQYKLQMDKMIEYYKKKATSNPRKKYCKRPRNHRRQSLTRLYKILGYLTCNYHLGGNKSEMLSGIYFKHEMLTDCSQLEFLDDYLTKIILDLDPNLFRFLGKSNEKSEKQSCENTYWENVKKVIFKKYSFVRGFKERRMCHLTSADFKMVKHILSNSNEA